MRITLIQFFFKAYYVVGSKYLLVFYLIKTVRTTYLQASCTSEDVNDLVVFEALCLIGKQLSSTMCLSKL